MVTFYQTSPVEERDRIKATFRTGRAQCISALLTLLYAIATFLLVIVHIATFIIHFSIGVLMIFHAFGCMARLLLVQCQEWAATPLVSVAGRSL